MNMFTHLNISDMRAAYMRKVSFLLQLFVRCLLAALECEREWSGKRFANLEGWNCVCRYDLWNATNVARDNQAWVLCNRAHDEL